MLKNDDRPDFTPRLRQLMQAAGISSFSELRRRAEVSQWQVRSLRSGKVLAMRVENLLQFARVLQVSPTELIATFSGEETGVRSHSELRQECDRLQQQLATQKEAIAEEITRSSLDILEPWLTFWPAAAYAVENNPDFEAKKLLALAKPIEKLLQTWGVEAIAAVGMQIPYDPQYHQLLGGVAEPGQTVRVRNPGYKQGDRLVLRAKVSPV